MIDQASEGAVFKINIDKNNNKNNDVDGKLYTFNQESSPKKWSFRLYGYPFSKIKWFNVFWLGACHGLAIFGYFYSVVMGVKFWTMFETVALGVMSGFGMNVGAHRLWSHRSYKAHWLMRTCLMILQTLSANGSILSYARDHRTHHKNSDTECDPKNPSRGLFYSHIGWWLLKKDQCVIDAGRKLNYDDLLNDPIVVFQHKYYKVLVIIFWGLVPFAFPFIWGETVLNAFFQPVFVRYIIFLHHFFTINSLAHFVGLRLYDSELRPTENKLVNYLTLGSGHHNFHHTFPYDYSESERRWFHEFNPATLVIDSAVGLGLAWDVKKAEQNTVESRVARTGFPEIYPLFYPKNKSACLQTIDTLIDWIIGSIVVSWALHLGIGLRILYLALTRDQVVFSEIVQF